MSNRPDRASWMISPPPEAYTQRHADDRDRRRAGAHSQHAEDGLEHPAQQVGHLQPFQQLHQEQQRQDYHEDVAQSLCQPDKPGAPGGLRHLRQRPPRGMLEEASPRVYLVQRQSQHQRRDDPKRPHEADPRPGLLSYAQLQGQGVGDKDHRRQHRHLGHGQFQLRRHRRKYRQAAVDVGRHGRRPHQAGLARQAQQLHHRREDVPKHVHHAQHVQHAHDDADRDHDLEQVPGRLQRVAEQLGAAATYRLRNGCQDGGSYHCDT